jgi:hypothetical protein
MQNNRLLTVLSRLLLLLLDGIDFAQLLQRFVGVIAQLDGV